MAYEKVAGTRTERKGMGRSEPSSLAAKLANKFIIDDAAGCWNWIAATNARGYGVVGRGGRGAGLHKAHRASWMVHRGDIPDGMWVLHKCDNPRCINPEHLYLGDHQQNVRDMVSRGRNVIPDNRGERASWAKLTAEAARDIKSRRLTGREFAELYRVSLSAVRRIWEGKNWSSL
jgi:hypothetical protein